MSDVIKIAQDKRARLLEEIETRMNEIEKLDNFIMFGARLASEEQSDAEPVAIAAE